MSNQQVFRASTVKTKTKTKTNTNTNTKTNTKKYKYKDKCKYKYSYLIIQQVRGASGAKSSKGWNLVWKKIFTPLGTPEVD